MTKFKPIGLGDRVKDPVTKFEGIITCVSTWLHGCIRVGVQAEDLDKDGKVPNESYFDQSQLELVAPGVHTPMTLEVAPDQPKPVTRRSNGGPGREGSGFSRS